MLPILLFILDLIKPERLNSRRSGAHRSQELLRGLRCGEAVPRRTRDEKFGLTPVAAGVVRLLRPDLQPG